MAARRREAAPAPLEATEQIWLFQWAADMEKLRWPDIDLMHHIPNGGSRNKIEAARLKAQGVKKGIPDVFLPIPRFGYHGLYVEMKRQKDGRLSDEQRDKIRRLRKYGYRVEVCKGFQAAADAIEAYMMGHMKPQGEEDSL